MSHPATKTTLDLAILHLFVTREGRPCVVSVLKDGSKELECKPFETEHRALAYLAILSGW